MAAVFSEIGSNNNLAVDRDVSLKFGMHMDFDFVKEVP